MQVNAEIPGAESGQSEEAAVKESVEAQSDMGTAEGKNVYTIETGWQCNPLW